MSHIAILAGQYHLSVRKVRSLTQEQFGTNFPVSAISEVQNRIAYTTVSSVQNQYTVCALIHVDETSHSRNDEERLQRAFTEQVQTADKGLAIGLDL